MAEIAYTTRERVKAALDIKETARNDAQVDEAIAAASRCVDGYLHRTFAPVLDTRTFDWPNPGSKTSYRLWLDADELISVDSITADGETITEYFLEPANDGPPFSSVDLDLSAATSSWPTGDTHQRTISITGLYGYRDDSAPAGDLADPIDDSTTTVDVTDSSAIGVGDTIRADDERMTVTGKAELDTGTDLAGSLDANKGTVSVPVGDGSGFTAGEVITIDAESMLVTRVVGNTLVVARAWDGSVLASHSSGADVFAPRRLTVDRGVLGTAADSHAGGTALTRLAVPPLVASLAVAEAITQLQQELSAYGRTVGSGDNEREASGRGLAGIRKQARTAHARKARLRSV